METYWLASSQVYKSALDKASLPSATCVFVGDEFREVMHLSPWLVPAEEVVNLPRAIVEQGIMLESEATMFEVNQHLNSLLFVMFEGEEMLIRFYDVSVLAPLIAQFDVAELDDFLGNIHRLHLYADGLKTYTRSRNHEYALQVRPWYRLNPEYMDESYSVTVHADSMIRRLWALFPNVMRQLDGRMSELVTRSLSLSQQAQLSPDVAELAALALLVENSPLSLSNMIKTFHLNSEEQFQLKQHMTNTNLVEGVCV
ncbi:DUF4123 domain-containing protein [Vibrio owensii]|uniref:DUF4123 domain-containing protein n=1 Tax=Vibrio owensii TaxID=696485 RepID=UPI003AAE79F7